MSYENQLIREATERYTPWCSACERDAEDCVCEELSDHLRETVNPAGDVCVPAPAGVRNIPVQVAEPFDRASAAHAIPEGRTVGSSPTTGAESFPEWLEKHNDHLKLPDSFREWIDQNEDSIIQ